MKPIQNYIEELLNYSKDEIQLCLVYLLIKNKINFIEINSAYVKYLELLKDDNKNKEVELISTIAELIINLNPKETINTKHCIHRALYNLNTSKKFNMESLNSLYNYNEEKDKELSYYYQQNK